MNPMPSEPDDPRLRRAGRVALWVTVTVVAAAALAVVGVMVVFAVAMSNFSNSSKG